MAGKYDYSVKKIVSRRLFKVSFLGADPEILGIYDPKLDHWYRYPGLNEQWMIIPEHELTYWRKIGGGFKTMEYIGTMYQRKRFDWSSLNKYRKNNQQPTDMNGNPVTQEELEEARAKLEETNSIDVENLGSDELG